MKKLKRLTIIFTFFSFSFLFFPKFIYAYIDPGTGSYIVQLIIAAFIAISFVIRVFWIKIKTFFSLIFLKKKHSNK